MSLLDGHTPAMAHAPGHYLANVRDIEFNLFEVLRIGNALDAGGYGDLGRDGAS